MYAELCQRLDKIVPNFEQNDVPITTFRKLLLTVCQHEFDNRESYFQNLCNNSNHNGETTAAATGTKTDNEEVRSIAKKKMLGNVKFIGELGQLDLLNEARLHKCIKTLLEKRKDEKYAEMSDDLECLCKMMPSIGLKLDQGEAVKLMDQYFDRIKKLQKIKEIPQRIRFLLQDLVELRLNKWIPRQTQLDNAPKTMKELRRGTEFEELTISNDHPLNHPMIQSNNYFVNGPIYPPPYGFPPNIFNIPPPPPYGAFQYPPHSANGKDPGYGSSFYHQNNQQSPQHNYSHYQQNDFYNNYFNQVSSMYMQQQQPVKNIASSSTTSINLEPLTKTPSASSVMSNHSTNNNNNNNSMVNEQQNSSSTTIGANQREKLNSSSSSSSHSSSNSFKPQQQTPNNNEISVKENGKNYNSKFF